MINSGYLKGVRLERELVTAFKADGYQATRTAGSHGLYDVVVYPADYTGRQTLARCGFEKRRRQEADEPSVERWDRQRKRLVDRLTVWTVRDSENGVWAYFIQAKCKGT